MTPEKCWLDNVPLDSISERYWQARCTCGGELAVHGLRHPHPIPLVECPGFLVDLTVQRQGLQSDEPTQPSLL